jgi:hypothetical protein
MTILLLTVPYGECLTVTVFFHGSNNVFYCCTYTIFPKRWNHQVQKHFFYGMLGAIKYHLDSLIALVSGSRDNIF